MHYTPLPNNVPKWLRRTKAAATAMLPPEEGAQYWRENPDDYNCPQRVSRDAGLQDIGCSLSPNPCSDFLRVQFDTPFIGDLVISDLSGRVVQQRSVYDEILTLEVPVEQLNNGVYLLSCTGLAGKLPSNVKFVVLRQFPLFLNQPSGPTHRVGLEGFNIYVCHAQNICCICSSLPPLFHLRPRQI